MDATQLSRWTRFASKGGIGKCIALQDCAAREPGDLMFYKDDEITVLMQLPDEDGIYLGYCEDIVGRFAATYVRFIGRLKTPVITKRSSSLSKSPRPRSLTPSRKRPPSQGSGPSFSRPPSRAEDPSSPSDTVLNSESPIHTHHDSLVTSSTSHSSSSSSQDPPSPPTPSDSYVEPPTNDKTIVPDLDATHVSENQLVPLSSPQRDPAPDSPRSFPSNSGPLDTTWVKLQPSDKVSHYVPTPSSPSRTEPALTSVPLTDSTNEDASRTSAAMSDGAADIGMFMLQGFGNADDDDDDGGNDDDDEDSGERTSLDDTVEGFPAPPTQIPTSSRATSFVLDTPPPPSAHSDESEDGDGASFYDNYRYSRLSVSSKMSKSSLRGALVAVPPPVPTELPQPVRDSLESLSVPTSPLASESVPPTPPSQDTLLPAARLATRNVPPPLTLGLKPSHAAAPSISSVASPLLHTGFISPQSSTNSRSPLSPVFDFRGSGAASALRQKIESERRSPLSSPLPSANSQQERTFEEQSQRVDREVSSPPRGVQPPTSPTISVSTTSSTSTSEKKKRGGPMPLVVMNPAQAPPPPYTPTSPLLTPASPTYSPMPMPSPVVPRISPQPTAAEPGPSIPRTSLFLPHPNAPKPSVASQGPLYWRSMPTVPPPPQNGVIQTLRRALTAQVRVGPNGLPQFATIYGSTTQDLFTSAGPVPIFFSTEPPNDVPVNRIRMAPNAPSPPVVPIPASPKAISPPSQGGLRPPAERNLNASASSTTPSNPNVNVNVIPRTNFIPKATTVRPRSRSFSGFDSPTVPAAQQKEKSRDEASIPSSEPTSSRTSSLAARAAAHTSRIHQARRHTPSPLALSQVTAGQGQQGQGPKSGPGSLPPPSPSPRSVSSPISPTTLRHVLKPVKSEPAFRASPSKSSEREAEMPVSPTTTTTREDPPSIQISAQESRGGKLSLDADSPAAPLPASSSSGSSSLVRNTSLRSKISLSALRSRSLREDRQQQQDDGVVLRGEGETVQVMDTDFEIVRPSVSRPRVSEESSANGKSSGSEGGRPSFLRVDSPATSLASDTRSPVSPSAPSPITSTISTTSSMSMIHSGAVEAHRALELKWVAAMAATPSAQARKNKKIRRLLLEGVPASVRYQVWAHLADSRAKRIEGLYVQLGERDRVAAFADIQHDAQECFLGDSRLAKHDGPLVSLLQSYLVMVPDIQYSRGLTFIAGQLLLQSPEEDAFWIFISLMDTHLRPYFSSNSVQLDIDASLFVKAVESVDSTTAKKLFVEMGIPPIRVCRPWFSSLFVEALPPEYFLRVWDIFMSEGVVFLFRIGLALVTCCRRAIRDMRSESDALTLLARPPAFLLSSTPTALIELCSSFRIKDDDIRKQRIKLEAQVKRQTQSRLSNAVRRGSRGNITLPTKS